MDSTFFVTTDWSERMEEKKKKKRNRDLETQWLSHFVGVSVCVWGNVESLNRYFITSSDRGRKLDGIHFPKSLLQ